MMRAVLLSFWHFISSVRFTLVLLSTTIVLVIAATLYEGHTRSHNQALSLYRHPGFISLLSGYFLNILTSALRRWPFKPHHVGFLITHLGLLMVLAGQALKIEKGVQGHLLLQEGTEKDLYLDSERLLLTVFKGSSDSQVSQSWTLDPSWGHFKSKTFSTFFDQSKLDVHLQSLTHGKRELYSFWSSHEQIQLEEEISSELLLKLPRYFFSGVDDLGKLQSLLEDSLFVNFKGQRLPLNGSEIEIEDFLVRARLEAPQKSLLPSSLLLTLRSKKEGTFTPEQSWRYFLDERVNYPWKCEHNPLKVTPKDFVITGSPFLGLYQTRSEETHLSGGLEYLFYFNEEGRWQESIHSADASTKLLVMKTGYGAWAEFSEKQPFRWNTKVLPYLDQTHFSNDLIENFYQEWAQEGGVGLLKNHDTSFTNQIEWNHLTSEQKTSLWLLHQLTQNVDWSSESGLWQHLKDRLWPLADDLKTVDPDFFQKQPDTHPNIWRLAQLIFQIKTLAPLVQAQVMPLLSQEASFFIQHPTYTQTLAWTLEGLHPSLITLFENIPTQKSLHLVSKASRHFVPSEGQDLDKELSTLHLKLTAEGQTEAIEIPVEKLDRGLAWPLLGGKYWIKASHPSYPLGYRIRLYQAFADFYPGSLTPQNYYAEVSWKKKESESPTYSSVSMNHVMELPSGYRFYLSSITPLQPTGARSALFTVNYDPYKNVLTYPGALLVSLGSLILLIRKRAYVQQLFR